MEQYEILQMLGQGAGSRVYLARHRLFDGLRAIKVISKNHPQVAAFLKEAQILYNLRHPGIPRIYEVIQDTKNYYLIQEYISGSSLQKLVSASEKISKTDSITYAVALCEIILYLHTMKPYPLLYLDFKPEHVILSGGRIRLLDFGSVREERELATGAGIPGTSGFLAPEVRAGEYPSKCTDIYGVGALLFFALTGTEYQGENDLKGNSRLIKVLRKCLHERPKDRYQNFEELKKDLEKLLKTETKKGGKASLTIVVAGAMERVGTTHFAIALTSWLNEKGPNAIYEEIGDRRVVDVLAQSDLAREDNGMIRIERFYGLPYFGTGIAEDCNGFPIRILDIGMLSPDMDDRKRRYLEEADTCFLVIGNREWENQSTLWALKQWNLPKKPTLLLRFGLTDCVYALLKEQKIREFYQVPFFRNIWKPEKEAGSFFQSLRIW